VRVTTAENKAIFPGSVLNPVAAAVVVAAAAASEAPADRLSATTAKKKAICLGNVPRAVAADAAAVVAATATIARSPVISLVTAPRSVKNAEAVDTEAAVADTEDAAAVVADTAAVADMEADAGAAAEAATSNVTNVRDTATCPGSAPIDEIPSNGLQTKKFRLNLLSRYFNPRILVGSIPS